MQITQKITNGNDLFAATEKLSIELDQAVSSRGNCGVSHFAVLIEKDPDEPHPPEIYGNWNQTLIQYQGDMFFVTDLELDFFKQIDGHTLFLSCKDDLLIKAVNSKGELSFPIDRIEGRMLDYAWGFGLDLIESEIIEEFGRLFLNGIGDCDVRMGFQLAGEINREYLIREGSAENNSKAGY